MSIDDIIYSLCLLCCIGVGYFVKRYKAERSIFTLLGCLMVIIALRFQSLHCFISSFLGAATVIYTHPGKCHLATFIVMFGYLIFFRLGYMIGLPEPTGHSNIIQMMLTLKLVGLALERQNGWRQVQKFKNHIGNINSPTTELEYFDIEIQLITMIDVLHYSFNYIGILIGPYYRYRTYRDYFEYSFKEHAPCHTETMEKIQQAILYALIYLIVNYQWPLEYALSKEFYDKRTIFYRMCYVMPIFLAFRFRMYAGFSLSECACTMVGFGAYPAESFAKSGEGPTITNYTHLKKNADKRVYNFETISNMNVKYYELSYTIRNAVYFWNKCVQYWLAMNVYKQFPYKTLRYFATFFCCAIWHGFEVGHYFCLMAMPIYLYIENIWNELMFKSMEDSQRPAIYFLFWISKFYNTSYVVTSFALGSYENIVKFYNSIYHIGFLMWTVMFILGLGMPTFRKVFEYIAHKSLKAARAQELQINH